MSAIRITKDISIDENELGFTFVRASGPGGQNVNKVATAVELRFDVLNSPSLGQDVRNRLITLSGKRVSDEGVLQIDARRFRTQQRNRTDAVERLVSLIRRAAARPKPRRKTTPTPTSIQLRLDQKRRRSKTRQLRRKVGEEDD